MFYIDILGMAGFAFHHKIDTDDVAVVKGFVHKKVDQLFKTTDEVTFSVIIKYGSGHVADRKTFHKFLRTSPVAIQLRRLHEVFK